MRPLTRLATSLLAVGALTVCTACGPQKSTSAANNDQAKVTVNNCGRDITYDAPVKRLFAYDGSIISIALAVGAHPELVAVSGLKNHQDLLRLKYGDQVDSLKQVSPKGPTMENIVAARPQVAFAGWNYGFSEAKNLTPDTLKERGIASYLLSETCLQGDKKTRGTIPPWEALRQDLLNIGKITGHDDTARGVVEDIARRREALEKAPTAAKKPMAFLFDSSSDQILSSGSFGAPQAVFDTAGADYALSDVKNTWTRVSWERITTADPDFIAFVDYPAQDFAAKVEALKSNPASAQLKAVKEGRFINLPYAMWTSGPMNIDAAESVRAAMEKWGLQPASGITPALDIRPLKLAGNTWME
ncbi:iron complex transport system substrate-binding protein [Austwickia chelonae]|uniref:Putative ABC transporter substrate-binding protein n=1 Tax=Austwickia chelonae NBRC 105200 TaxID=1184607 RepID=K6VSI0_9MICO|nr:ABC transporter substrate-binding protein [Austwickia chelonae]GAB78300.1 putative ABC transporter substrate-binding protein [Austwickia chelonae NBRC 105200]SEW00772.1 iron complex transport system substrate-binding protein [Austwickia chelonae]